MHVSHMTRRSFLSASALAAGTLALGGCASASEPQEAVAPATVDEAVREVPVDPLAAVEGEIAPAHHEDHAGSGPKVFFVPVVTAESIQMAYDAIGKTLPGKVGVKISSGEPGSNNLDPQLIAGLVTSVAGDIVECNVAYGGPRHETGSHYQVARDHGYFDIADFKILDEGGHIGLPVTGGFHLSENLVGAGFHDYDSYLILSHFKGHMMAGFGGALKNTSIGLAAAAGKFRIHTAGKHDDDWEGSTTATFQEAMADAVKSVADALGPDNILYVNVMNRLSVDCDCDDHPHEPKMADIGVLASVDPVALDQACIDLIYASDNDSIDLISRIETLNGEHVLEAAEQIGVGSRSYELVQIA